MYILHRTGVVLASLCLLTSCAEKKSAIFKDQTVVQSRVRNPPANPTQVDELLSIQDHSIPNIGQAVSHLQDSSGVVPGSKAAEVGGELNADQAVLQLQDNSIEVHGPIASESGGEPEVGQVLPQIHGNSGDVPGSAAADVESEPNVDQAILQSQANSIELPGSLDHESDNKLDADPAELQIPDNSGKVNGSLVAKGDLNTSQAVLQSLGDWNEVHGSIAEENDSILNPDSIVLQFQHDLKNAVQSLFFQDNIVVTTERPTRESESDSSPDTELNHVANDGELSEPERHSNLWDRLLSLYSIPHIDRLEIDTEVKRFKNHSKYFQRVQNRAVPFLFDIVEKIEENSMPGEIALLPIVESGFRPYAYSQESASGIWQFTPGTAQRFGLNKNWWYDGRRDIYSSTIAALRYLKILHRSFNDDWLLALAAYNSGEGTVRRAIRKNRARQKPTDFWNLRLPRETRNYVPRLLALARIFQNAEEYGIEIRPIPDKPVLEIVDIGSQMDLAVAAELAEMTVKELVRFNPGFKKWATSPDGPHRLLVPVDKADIFQINLAGLDEKDRIRTIRHQVRSGETLSHIAENYGITVAVLRRANSIQGHLIHPGKNLAIPFAKLSASAYSNASMKKPSVANREKITYVVRSGDSFWEISKKYAVNTKKLAKWNNMSTKTSIMPGQKLTIWLPNSVLETGSRSDDGFRAIDYTVRRGDSLYGISRRFKVKITDLQRWNVPRLGKYLQPGQKLTVRLEEI